jgi:tripeptide aminopeptidase
MHTFDDPAALLGSTRLLDRFLNYVQVDTQSDENSTTCPSTECQLDLARTLVGELRELGIADAEVDENGYVTASLPGQRPGQLGLIAHLDTAPAFSGSQVKPVLHEGYDGQRLALGNGIVLDPADNPELSQCRGDTIITADGTTLLGADDKAGIAAIMTMLEILRDRPELAHPTLKICFNPDEEIGRGAHRFPLERFGAPFAVTVDGGFPGELNIETFSADKAVLRFTGVAVHPGKAKGKMVNALTYAGKFLARLPMAESPECTEDKDGFIHPTDISGDAAQCTLSLILRDFDDEILAERGRRVQAIAEGLQAEEPKLGVHVEIKEQYRNMIHGLRDQPRFLEILEQAVRSAGLEPNVEPVRGGTDGSQLTAKGMPTPNVFAGGMNFHGPQEWISSRALALSACTLLNLVQLWEAPEQA